MDVIKIEGYTVLPARVDGSHDVFQAPRFVLCKPIWVPDESMNKCDLCHSKFSQLKRRHHCRMCGGVRCAKCCNQKIPLPQLGEEQPERVCDGCLTVTELVTKSRSTIESFLLESAKGLSSFSKHSKHIKKLLELGGMQTLVTLSLTDNAQVLGQVVSGLHALSTYTNLHPFLADAGAIKAICKILRTVGDSSEQAVLDGIGALMIFSKFPELKSKVLNDGGLKPIIDLCFSADEAVSMLAVRALGLIAENPSTHDAIFADPQNIVLRLIQLTRAFDEQVQEISSRTLCFLSAGSSQHKNRLLQGEYTSGRQLFEAFESTPNNQQIICNVACIVANVATSAENQVGLQDWFHSACKKLSSAESNTELLCHLTRALANFAHHEQNSSHLFEYVPDIINYSLKSSNAGVQAQSMRLLIALLSYEPNIVGPMLMSNGGLAFLKYLVAIPHLVPSIQTVLSNQAPDIAKPF